MKTNIKNKYFKKIYEQNNGKYYLGLDIGTNSIGWAVHTEDYKLIDFGVYLDNKVEDSKARRDSRSSKRNLNRKIKRLNMFEDLAIDKKLIAKGLKENTNFKMYDKYFLDKREEENYENNLFPTIYHLKKKALEDKVTQEDLFLCLRHSLKLRGHFLTELPYENLIVNMKKNELIDQWLEKFYVSNPTSFFDTIVTINKSYTKQVDRKKALEEEYESCDKSEDLGKKELKELKDNLINEILFLFGYSKSLSHLEGMPVDEKGKVKSFKIEKIDEQVDLPKDVYDLEQISSILEVKKVLGEHLILSEYMVAKYNLYNPSHENYEENIKLFAEENKDFVKDYNKKNKKIPYLRNYENRRIPNQLYYDEAMQIINKQKEYYPNILDADFIKKYGQLLKSRIPYYIGPIAKYKEYSENSWIDRSLNPELNNVDPYNIENLDHAKINKRFIEEMVKTDPYFRDEKVSVLPNRSYSYEYYKVLADLSNFIVSDDNDTTGRHLTKEEKEILINKFYKSKDAKSVTLKKVRDSIDQHLKFINPKLYNDSIDDNTKFASLKTYIELNINFNLDLNDDKLDELAYIFTLYEDYNLKKQEVSKFLQENNINLEEKDFKRLLLLKYQGYGKFSKRFLYETNFKIEENEDSIVNLLLNKDIRLNEILSSNDMDIQNQEKFYESKFKSKKNKKYFKLDYSLVEEMYGSNIVKAMLNNLFIVMNELHKIYGIPKSVTIEMAREKTGGGQVKSRETQLEYQIKEIKKKDKHAKNYEWIKNIEEYLSQGKKAYDKILLYFQQEGKDLYSFKDGKCQNIDFNKMVSRDSEYDVDHIIPYSFNFDDSINNKVLVNQKYNAIKNNNVPLEINGLDKETYTLFIKDLRKRELISAKKRDNLLMDSFSKYEKQGFKNSQLNDTRYITKEIVAILKSYYNAINIEGSNSKVNINTISANVVKPIDRKCKIIKIREISDKHHAIDAYMASVVYTAIKKKVPWIDSIRSAIIKNKLTDEQKEKYVKSKNDYVKQYKFLNAICEEINSDSIINMLDKKEYKRVYKVRKKVTGQFWDQNYGSKEEKSKIADKLVYRTDKNKLKQQQAITKINSARVDIFRKNGKNYMFAVPLSYFNKVGNKITLNKDAYNHGLNVMNKEIWNKKQKDGENIVLEDFKFTLWYNDMFKLDNEIYFRNGARLDNQILEGKILNEKAFSIQEVFNYIFEEVEVGKYKYKNKIELLEEISKNNNGEEVMFNKENDGTSKKTISLNNMLYWYKYFDEDYDSVLNENSTVYYDTPIKQEIAENYFKHLVQGKIFSTNEEKAIKKEFDEMYKTSKEVVKEEKKRIEELKEEVNFVRLSRLNSYQLVSEYNKTLILNKQKRNFLAIQNKDVYKVVQSPLGHRQRKIYNEKFVWEFEVK